MRLQRAIGRVERASEPDASGCQYITVRLGGEGEGPLAPAICFPGLTGPVGPGQRVLLNTTAVDLALGSGGFHFVMASLDGATPDGAPPSGAPLEGEAAGEGGKGDGPPASPAPGGSGRAAGHIMKLRYTPFQLAVQAAEEEGSPYRGELLGAGSLDGQPVVVGSVHSQLAPAVAGIKARRPAARVAYVMTDGGALPLALSRTAAALRRRGALCGCVTSGHAFGGDIEAVNIYSALLAARHALGADVTVAVMGPGVVGTGSPFGHTGLEVAQLVDAVAALGGEPVVIPRLSAADPRPRHRGISHHTLTALGRLAHARATVALPPLPPSMALGVKEALYRSGVLPRHRLWEGPDGPLAPLAGDFTGLFHSMGRSYEDDPPFFDAALAAGFYAAGRIPGDAGGTPPAP